MTAENKMVTPTNLDVIEHDQFVLVGRISTDEHYADGVTQVYFGFPLTKILFHNMLEPKTKTAREIRKAEQFLTMPTASAIELANIILSSAKNSEEQLLKDMPENSREKIRAILSNYSFNSPIGGFQSVKISEAPAKGK